MPQRKQKFYFPFCLSEANLLPSKKSTHRQFKVLVFPQANNQIYFLPKTESTRQHEDLECFLQDKRGHIFSSKQQTVCCQRKKFSTFLFVSGKLVAFEQINAYSSQMLNFQVLGFEMLHKENNSFDTTFHRGEMGELLVLASYKSA